MVQRFRSVALKILYYPFNCVNPATTTTWETTQMRLWQCCHYEGKPSSPLPVLTLGRPRSLAAPASISVAGCLPTAELPRCQKWRTRRNTATAHCRAWARYPAGASPISAYLGTRKICWINALLCFNSVSLLIMIPLVSFDCAVTAGDIRKNGEGGFEYSNCEKWINHQAHALSQYCLNSLGIRLMALSGLSTRIVLIAVKLRFSTCRQYSRAPASTMKKSSRFQESARYVFLP